MKTDELIRKALQAGVDSIPFRESKEAEQTRALDPVRWKPKGRHEKSWSLLSESAAALVFTFLSCLILIGMTRPEFAVLRPLASELSRQIPPDLDEKFISFFANVWRYYHG
jgi:hypothetical protein